MPSWSRVGRMGRRRLRRPAVRGFSRRAAGRCRERAVPPLLRHNRRGGRYATRAGRFGNASTASASMAPSPRRTTASRYWMPPMLPFSARKWRVPKSTREISRRRRAEPPGMTARTGAGGWVPEWLAGGRGLRPFYTVLKDGTSWTSWTAAAGAAASRPDADNRLARSTVLRWTPRFARARRLGGFRVRQREHAAKERS